jgi:antitoxin component YwqK of YwqJK toxin-antitoxin module
MMIRVALASCLLFCCNACNLTSQKKMTIHYVQNFDPLLKKINGWWFYKNELLNGQIEEKSLDGKSVLYYVPVINGLEEGQASGRYNTGEKLLTRNYTKGKIEGEFIQWWPNSNKRYLLNYKHNQLDGKQMVFYPNGDRHEENNYAEGTVEGIQRVWNEGGQLISNYTIRNKKLYGVISVKSCLPEGQH